MRENIEVQNLKCGGCAGTIKSKIGELEGVSVIDVDTESSVVSVDVLNTETLEVVSSRLASLGYPTVGANNSFGKKAKSYVSCAIGKLNTEA